MRIRTHQYAEAAYPLVKNEVQGKSFEAKYRTLALNFPTMIMQSGLMQSIGFLMAKISDKEPQYQKFLNHLEVILKTDNKTFKDDLHTDLRKSDITEYQLLTRKALDASSWLKRYTQALLKKEGET